MKKNTAFNLPRLLILLGLTLSLLFLTSCFSAGSGTVYSKDELTENVSSSENEGYGRVWEYLDEWNFPKFSMYRLREVEDIFEDRFYKDIPEAYGAAKLTAASFIENYYDSIDLSDSEKVTEAIISSYVLSVGDRYSVFRTPVEYDNYYSNMSGNYVGIGVTVTKLEGLIKIISVTEGSSAEAAGLKADDYIIEVDGKSVLNIGYSAAVDLIPGEEGSFVNLTVKRSDAQLEFKVERKTIVEKSVTYYLEDGIGYIRIKSFKSNTDEQFAEAIDYMENNGARGVIYDVRSNGGGYLTTVENMLSYIAPEGMTLVSFSNDYGEDFKSNDPHTYYIPSVVLCDEYTASAAELFTAGIRDIAKECGFDAKIVGTTTLGKGIMQNTYHLSDGSTLTLTVAYYNPPSGINYHEIGITPDVSVELGGEDDNQLSRAKEEIKKLING